MFRRNKQTSIEAGKLPELRAPRDLIAAYGRIIRDRYDALRPRTDLKHWR